MEFTPKILSKLKKGDRTVQKLLYDDYSAYFFGILRRYVKTQEDAEDLLCTAFYKIMTKVDQLDEPAKMHGWMKRIVINEALMFLRSKKNLSMHLEMDENLIEHDQYILPKMYADDILEMVDTLPDGYRTVFNLYAIEGYKHKEIAEELGISIHTSKTQYMMAKKRLVEMLKKNKINNEQGNSSYQSGS